jgi:membrane-bound metal-dependent hydrolase YbcI (DUF457 family)
MATAVRLRLRLRLRWPPPLAGGPSVEGKDHAALAVAAFAGAAWAGAHYFGLRPLSAVEACLGVVVAAGSGLAPDLDEKHSRAGRASPLSWFPIYGGHRQRTHWLSTVATVAAVAVLCQSNRTASAVLVGVACCMGGAALSRLLRGGGVLLCVPFGVAMATAAYRWVPGGWWLVAAVAVPYASHIAGDVPTPGGLPLWGPWSKRKVSLHLFKVGGPAEHLVVAPLVHGLALWSLYAVFYPTVMTWAHRSLAGAR